MTLADYRKSRGLSLEQVAHELGLKSKGRISDIENGVVDCPLELALQIQVWSDGAIRAADLRPDKADLIAAIAAQAAQPEGAAA